MLDMNRAAHSRSASHLVTPFVAGDARDPRQRTLTVLAFACFALPTLAAVAVLSYAATGAPLDHVLPATSPWPGVRAAVPTLLFGIGAGVAVLAIGRSPVRNARAISAVVLNGVGLVVAAMIVAGPAIAAVAER
jgi:hypothetical protein